MQSGILPAQAMCVKVSLPEKPSGGDRPISVLSNLYRSLVSIQGPELRRWEAEKAGEWDFATKGKGAVVGAFDSETRLECIRHAQQTHHDWE